jgi:hypothetical protein
MSFTLSETIHASKSVVWCLLSDLDSVKLYNPNVISTDHSRDHGRLSPGHRWRESMRQLYLRHNAGFQCLAADEAAGVIQWEMDDGFHVARYTWLLRPLSETVMRVELRVDCNVLTGGVSTPSDSLASMLKRDEIRTMQSFKQLAERTMGGQSPVEQPSHSAARELLAW